MATFTIFINSALLFSIGWIVTASSGPELIHRFAVGSCSNPNKGGKIWRMINSYSPDHLVLLGDIVYADYEAMGKVMPELPGKIMREYGILERDKHWNNLKSSVKYWSITYDDHDYGNNNGDKTFLFRNFSMNAFREFSKDAFAGIEVETRNGVYSSKLIHVPGKNGKSFVYKLILMDSRSNKDPKGTPGGDFLGEEQWAWLTAELSDTSVDLIVLGSSIQVLSDDKIVEENWSEFPAARERLLRMVTAASLQTNVVLLSGDVHRAEISHAECTFSSDSDDSQQNKLSKFKADLWELTSSGLAHTMRFYTGDSALTSQADYVDQDTEPFTVPVRSRNILVRYADMIYQFAYPGYYREDKNAHAYAEIHFSLLDVVASEGAASGLELVHRVISHRHEEVMRKVLPLRTRAEILQARTVPGTQSSTADLVDAARLLTGGSDGVRVHCLPHWGVVPLWREVQYRAVIAVAMLLFLVVPLLALLWYLGAALYYIVRGSELKRRAEVEQRYQQNKKVD